MPATWRRSRNRAMCLRPTAAQNRTATSVRSFPPIAFAYSRVPDARRSRCCRWRPWPDTTSTPSSPAREAPPVQWVDLDGEGAVGLLSEHEGAWLYRRNAGGRQPGRKRIAGTPGSSRRSSSGSDLPPACGRERATLMDLAGDGQTRPRFDAAADERLLRAHRIERLGAVPGLRAVPERGHERSQPADARPGWRRDRRDHGDGGRGDHLVSRARGNRIRRGQSRRAGRRRGTRTTAGVQRCLGLVRRGRFQRRRRIATWCGSATARSATGRTSATGGSGRR